MKSIFYKTCLAAMVVTALIVRAKSDKKEALPCVIFAKSSSGYIDDQFYYRYVDFNGISGDFYDKKEYNIGDTITR